MKGRVGERKVEGELEACVGAPEVEVERRGSSRSGANLATCAVPIGQLMWHLLDSSTADENVLDLVRARFAAQVSPARVKGADLRQREHQLRSRAY